MINVLVTGVGSLLGQGILKSIRNSNLDCNIIGTDYFASAVGLYWVNKGFILPDILKSEINESDWIDALLNIINDEEVDIIIPGLDFEVPILSRNKLLIEKTTKSIVVVSPEEIVNIGDDKWETFLYLKKNDFIYPNSSLPETVEAFVDSNKFPLIVKPRFGHTSENVFLVNNIQELNESIKICDKPIIQEYLTNENKEYTCGVTYFNDRILTLISLRRTLKNGNTNQAFCEPTDDIDEYIKKLTLSIKPYGPINFQLRMTQKGPVVFEINTRFSGTTPIRSLFGINEVEATIKKLMNINMDTHYEEKKGTVIRYFENQYISKDKYKEF